MRNHGLIFSAFGVLAFAVTANMALAAQAPPTPPAAQDNNAYPDFGYHEVPGWGKLPAGRKWGGVSGIDIDKDGKSVWVFDRCENADDGCNIHKDEDPILKFDQNGNLYGTASLGGHYGDGVVYKIQPGGPYTLLHVFSGPDGRDPSWLWDVPFEKLAGRAVIATGERATDLAVRLDHAGVAYRKDTRAPLLAARSAHESPVVIAATYTNFLSLSRELDRGH